MSWRVTHRERVRCVGEKGYQRVHRSLQHRLLILWGSCDHVISHDLESTCKNAYLPEYDCCLIFVRPNCKIYKQRDKSHDNTVKIM